MLLCLAPPYISSKIKVDKDGSVQAQFSPLLLWCEERKKRIVLGSSVA